MGTQIQTLDQIVQELGTRGNHTSPTNASSGDHSLRNPTRAQLSTALIHSGAALSKDGRSYSWEEERDLVTEVSHILYRDQLSARADLLYGNEDGGEIPFDEIDLIRATTFAARTAIASHATMASQRTPQAIALSKFLRNGGLGGHYIGTKKGKHFVANRNGEFLSDEQIQENIDAVRGHIMPEDVVCATAMALGYDEERIQEDQEWIIGSFAKDLPADWKTPITPARLAQTVAKGMKDLANAYLWKAIPAAVENVFGKKETAQPFHAAVMSRLHDRYVPINEPGATTVLDENKQQHNIDELVSQTVKDVSYDLVSGKITLDSSKSSADQTKYDELSQEVDRLSNLLGEYETEAQEDAKKIEALKLELASSRDDVDEARTASERATVLLADYRKSVVAELADRDTRIEILETQLAGADAQRDPSVEAALERGEEAAAAQYAIDMALQSDRIAHLKGALDVILAYAIDNGIVPVDHDGEPSSIIDGFEQFVSRYEEQIASYGSQIDERDEVIKQWRAAFAEQTADYAAQTKELGARDKVIASYQEGQRILTDIARARGMITEKESLTAGNFETALDRLVVPYKTKIVAAEERLRQATQAPEAQDGTKRYTVDKITKADF